MGRSHPQSAVLALLAGIVGMACTRELPNHCANLDGDRTCAAGGGLFCSSCVLANDGCADIRPSDECYFPGPGQGGGLSTTDGTANPSDTTSTTNPTSDGTIAEETTLALTSESEATTGTECISDAECGDAMPFCGPSGECVACGGTVDPDAACAGKDSILPICVNDACVSCADGLMLNDAMTGECLPCTEHDQCESGACDIFEGTCFDPDRVVEVGGAGQPESIAEGLVYLQKLGVDRRGERRGVLVLRDDTGLDFDESIVISGSDTQAVAFIAEQPDQSPDWGHAADAMPSPTLTVTGATTRVYLDRIVLRNDTNTSDGQSLFCDDAHVDIRRSQLIENLGGGIVAQGQCELVVQNSFVGVNPDNSSTFFDSIDALLIVDDNVRATILYSTLGAGLGAAALRCPNGGPNVNVRNSFLVSEASISPEVDCENVMLTTNATEAEADPISPSDIDPSWFVNYDEGNFHLTANAPDGIIVAQWLNGDPVVDIDGEQRVLDQPGYAGADHP